MQIEDAASSRRARWLFLLATLAVVFVSSAHFVTSDILGSIDWQRCFLVSGTSTPYVSVDDASFLEALALVFEEIETDDFILFALFSTTYIPLVWASAGVKLRRTQFAILVMTVLIALILSLFNSEPSAMHHCDRKGSYHWILAIGVPFVSLFPLGFLTLIVVIFGESK